MCALWCGTLKTSVCAFKTSPCMLATSTHAFQPSTRGEREGVIASSAYQNLPTLGYHLTPEVHQRNPWISHIFSLRIDRQQHVPDSSNHSLYLVKLFSFSNLEENFGGNQLPDGSICLSPSSLRPSTTTTASTTTTTTHNTTSHTTLGDRHRERESEKK